MHKFLRELRLKNKYTCQYVADRVKIGRGFYSQIEAGTRRLSYENAVKIAKVFNLKPDEIFYDDYNKID